MVVEEVEVLLLVLMSLFYICHANNSHSDRIQCIGLIFICGFDEKTKNVPQFTQLRTATFRRALKQICCMSVRLAQERLATRPGRAGMFPPKRMSQRERGTWQWWLEPTCINSQQLIVKYSGVS